MSIDIPFTLNTMLSSNEDTSSYEDYHSILEQYLNQKIRYNEHLKSKTNEYKLLYCNYKTKLPITFYENHNSHVAEITDPKLPNVYMDMVDGANNKIKQNTIFRYSLLKKPSLNLKDELEKTIDNLGSFFSIQKEFLIRNIHDSDIVNKNTDLVILSDKNIETTLSKSMYDHNLDDQLTDNKIIIKKKYDYLVATYKKYIQKIHFIKNVMKDIVETKFLDLNFNNINRVLYNIFVTNFITPITNLNDSETLTNYIFLLAICNSSNTIEKNNLFIKNNLDVQKLSFNDLHLITDVSDLMVDSITYDISKKKFIKVKNIKINQITTLTGIGNFDENKNLNFNVSIENLINNYQNEKFFDESIKSLIPLQYELKWEHPKIKKMIKGETNLQPNIIKKEIEDIPHRILYTQTKKKYFNQLTQKIKLDKTKLVYITNKATPIDMLGDHFLDSINQSELSSFSELNSISNWRNILSRDYIEIKNNTKIPIIVNKLPFLTVYHYIYYHLFNAAKNIDKRICKLFIYGNELGSEIPDSVSEILDSLNKKNKIVMPEIDASILSSLEKKSTIAKLIQLNAVDILKNTDNCTLFCSKINDPNKLIYMNELMEIRDDIIAGKDINYDGLEEDKQLFESQTYDKGEHIDISVLFKKNTAKIHTGGAILPIKSISSVNLKDKDVDRFKNSDEKIYERFLDKLNFSDRSFNVIITNNNDDSLYISVIKVLHDSNQLPDILNIKQNMEGLDVNSSVSKLRLLTSKIFKMNMNKIDSSDFKLRSKQDYLENIVNGRSNKLNGTLDDKYELVFISLLLNIKITIHVFNSYNEIDTINIYSGGSQKSKFNLSDDVSNEIADLVNLNNSKQLININLGYIQESRQYVGLVDKLDLLETTLAIEPFNHDKYFYLKYDNYHLALEHVDQEIPYKVVGVYDKSTRKIKYLSEIDLQNLLKKKVNNKKNTLIENDINNIIIKEKYKIIPINYYRDLVDDIIYTKSNNTYIKVGNLDDYPVFEY